MKIQSYDELVAPDERNKLMGFMQARMGGGFDVRVAAETGQGYVARVDLADDVPKALVASYERVRRVFSFGLFDYDLFTVARDQAILLLEQALRERFVAFYEGEVTLRRLSDGDERTMTVQDFDGVWSFLNRGKRSRQPWTIRLRSGGWFGPDNGGPDSFKGSLRHLQMWARTEGLLIGQRAKALDENYAKERNAIAHPHYSLTDSSDAAMMIGDMGETIQCLWGHRTPGGHRYPAPLERTTFALAWAPDGSGTQRLDDEYISGFPAPDNWLFAVVQAVRDDDLTCFDSRYERTHYPADLLYGPASREDAIAWLEEHGTHTDEADHLDRLFAVQVHDGLTYLARRPEVALGLAEDRRGGEWHLVVADNGLDAFNLIRLPLVQGKRPAVAAMEVFSGTWQGMAEAPQLAGAVAVSTPVVWIPGHFSRVAPDVGAD